MRNPDVTIYADGACSGNPGPGGWGAVLLRLDEKREIITKELSGGELDSTNIRMEMTAALEALRALKTTCRVKLYTDSEFVAKGMTEWLAGWKQNGWRRGSRGKYRRLENRDLWELLDEIAQQHDIEWHWVRGHDGNIYNERADKLAVQAVKQIRRKVSDERKD